MNDEYEDRELGDIPPDELQGSVAVKFNVPIPDVEQVCSEMARQLLATKAFSKYELTKVATNALHEAVNRVVAADVEPIIRDLLSKPIRPTDAFGNPIGEETTLHGALAKRVTDWCTDTVDSEGKPQKPDTYSSASIHPRINWALGKIVNGEMKKLVDVEVNRIIMQLKESATANIAKQIAEKISGLVLK